MVMGYEGTESVWTEIDIYTDDPTNAFDGTWTALQIWR
jgi:hypothetical protein